MRKNNFMNKIIKLKGSILAGVLNINECKIKIWKQATAVCDCFVFYNCADRSASYPDCNGTYEEQKTEKYVGRTDGGKTAFG